MEPRLEREPLEKRVLDRQCTELGIPGDFDVAQISWKPDYDAFFYNQLRRRARRRASSMSASNSREAWSGRCGTSTVIR